MFPDLDFLCFVYDGLRSFRLYSTYLVFFSKSPWTCLCLFIPVTRRQQLSPKPVMKFNRIRDPQPQAIVPQVDGSWFSMSSYGGGMIKPATNDQPPIQWWWWWWFQLGTPSALRLTCGHTSISSSKPMNISPFRLVDSGNHLVPRRLVVHRNYKPSLRNAVCHKSPIQDNNNLPS